MARQRYVVIDEATGVILKSGWSSDASAQAGAGQKALALVGSDGGYISDENVQIDVVTLTFEPVGSYAGDLPNVDEIVDLAPE